ncbi:hypothetical protein [Actinoplanes sp. NPDC049118]|uniref:hypothetical protein n=1 Tax=Actinoplanes sp. NPDC049118 TaxID=3155769 RepID=UPI00340EFA40
MEDKTQLTAWSKRMVLAGAARSPDLLAQARSLDPADPQHKQPLNALAERAANAAGSASRRDHGTHLHTLSEYVDRGEPLPAHSAADVADMAAYKLATVHLDVIHVERLVVVDDLRVAGTPDRISYYDGPGPDGDYLTGNLITDLKTGSLQHGTLKFAMQLAVYSRGQFYDHTTGARSPLPQVNPHWGLIIHLTPGSAICTVHWIDLALGWDAVQVARQVRAMRSRKSVLKQFDPTATIKEVVASGLNV